MEILGFYEAINDGARKAVKDFNYCLVGVVSSVDKLNDGLLDIDPVSNYLDYSMTECQMPILYDVPVVYPNTLSSSMTMPIKQGDGVLVVFTQHRTDDYLDGVKGKHLPLSQSWLALHNAVAFIGFQNIGDSGYNPNNYSNKLNMNDVNIVHNKNTDKEVVITLSDTGDLKITAPQKVSIISKSADVTCKEDVNIKTNGTTNITGNGDISLTSSSNVNIKAPMINMGQ